MSTVGLRELAKYKVGEAEVTIFGDYRRNLGKYIVREPALTESGRAIYSRLLKELQASPSVGETTTIESLKKEIATAARTLDVAAEVEK